MVFLEIIQQLDLDIWAVFEFQTCLLYKDVNALVQVKYFLKSFEFPVEQLMPVAQFLNLRRCEYAGCLGLLNQLFEIIAFYLASGVLILC